MLNKKANYYFSLYNSISNIYKGSDKHMPFPVEWEKFLWEEILFLTYIIICGSLIQLRFSKKTSLLAAGITIAGIVVLQAILLSFKDPTFVLTLFPLRPH